MSVLAQAAMSAACDDYIDEFERMIDRIKRSTPELALGYNGHAGWIGFTTRPWFVFDKANRSEVVWRGETFEAADRFARAHAARCGATIDYRSFRELAS